jgi:hypothetical protein
MSLRFFFLLTPRLLGTGKHDTTYTQKKKKTSVHQKKRGKERLTPHARKHTRVYSNNNKRKKKRAYSFIHADVMSKKEARPAVFFLSLFFGSSCCGGCSFLFISFLKVRSELARLRRSRHTSRCVVQDSPPCSFAVVDIFFFFQTHVQVPPHRHLPKHIHNTQARTHSTIYRNKKKW